MGCKRPLTSQSGLVPTIIASRAEKCECFAIISIMKLFVGVKALIEKEGKVLLIREAKYDEGLNEGKWDVPGGRIEVEETLMEGLSREVFEETGLKVMSTRILDVHETFREKVGEKWHIVRVYYRTEVEGEIVLSKDHDAYEWVNPADYGGKILMTDVAGLLDSGLTPISHIKSVW